MSLDEVAVGQGACVVRIELDAPTASLVRAMGVVEGARLVVLRRAPFGGPLQVRGAEADFAVGLPIARGLIVTSSDEAR